MRSDVSNIALILLCMLAGVLLRKSGRLPPDAPKALNAVVTFVSLPALVLLKVPPALAAASLDRDVLAPISMAWLSFALAFLVLRWLGARLGWTPATTGALVLTVGLGNTSFVGYPLLTWLLGPEALPVGILADQPGSFLVLSTVAVAAAASFGGKRVQFASIARQVVAFPPFLALLAAFVWAISGAPRPAGIGDLLEKLASTLVPLALVSVGASLSIQRQVLRRRLALVGLGLALKLVVMPALFLGLYGYALGMRGLAGRVTILESAMAPMITSAVLVAEFGLDEELAGLLIGIGVPLSIVTVAAWNAALGWLL